MNTTICRNGYIPCNKRRFWDAELVFFRPGFGFVRVAFGSGENLSAEDMDMRDENGNKIDDYLIIYTYTGEPDEGSWIHVFPEKDEIGKCGLRFVETDGAQQLFSRKSHRSGDLREFLPEAFAMVDFPRDLKGYFLVRKYGQFWDRPHPLGYRPKKKVKEKHEQHS